MSSHPARRHRLRVGLLGGTALAAPFAALAQAPAPGTRPVLDRVVAGGITVQQDAARTQVNQAQQRGIVDWRSFNVGSDHQVQFQQPSSSAVTLNRVTTPDPSAIAGRISANGQLVIVNQSGVVFSQGSQVDAAGLVVSAAGITNQNFMAGRMVFDQPARPGARVENQGRITVREAGLAALVAPQVANHGTITARLGRVALAGAETHAIDLYGDGMLSVEVTGRVRQAPNGGTALVTNTGVIEARGGTVQLTAEAVDGIVQDLVRVGGRVSASTDAATGRTGRVMIAGTGGAVRIEGEVRAAGRAPGTRGGTVEVLGDRVRVEATGRIDASGTAGGGEIALGTPRSGAPQARLARRVSTAPGAVVRADATASGRGGTVRINSAEYTEHAGEISARGGPQGGDGGFVEVSGQQGLRTPGRIDVGAAAGLPGTILFDPAVLEIVASGSDALPPSGAIGANDPPTNATISASDINNFNGNVVLAATQDIFVRVPLSGGSTVGSLTMTAGRDLQVDAPIDNFRGLTLEASGGDLRINARLFNNGATVLTAGGGITVSDSTFSLTASSLTATAGGTVTLGAPGSAFSSLTITGGPARFSAGQDVIVQTQLIGGSSAGSLTLTGGRDVLVGATISGFPSITLDAGTDGATQALIPGSTGTLTLSAGVASTGALRLQAGLGGITQSAGLSAQSLSVSTAGSATLTLLSGSTPANRIDSLAASDVAGDFALAAQAFTTPGTAIALQGTIQVGGRFTLRAENGASQAAAPTTGPTNAIFAAEFDGQAPAGSFSLLGDNGIGTLTYDGGGLVLRNLSDLQIGTAGVSSRGSVQITVFGGSIAADGPVSGFGISMDAAGDLSIGAALTSPFSPITLRAGGTLALAGSGSVTTGSAASITLLSGVDFSGSGTTDPAAAGGLQLAGTVTAGQGGDVTLGAGTGGIAQTGGGIQAGALTVLPSGGDTLLGQPGNAIQQLGSVQVAGRFLLDNGTTALAVLGPVTAQAIALRTQGAITVQRSAVLQAAGAGGTIGFASGGLTFQAGAQVTAETVEIAPFAATPVSLSVIPAAITADTLRVGGVTFPDRGPDPVITATSITIAAPLSFPGRLDLRSTGAIGQASGAVLDVGTLSGVSGGTVLLDNPANRIGALGGFVVSGGNGFTLAAAGDLAVTGPLTVAGGAVQLLVAGLLSQSSAGAITAARLSGSAGTGAALDVAANDIASLGGFDSGSGNLKLLTTGLQIGVPGGTTVRAGGALQIVATSGGLTVDGTVTGGDVALQAAGALAVNGFSAIARSGSLLLAGDTVTVAGLIQAGHALTVQATSTASLSGRAVSTGSATLPPAGLTISAPRISFGGLDARGLPVTLALGAAGTAAGALDAGGLIVQGGAGASLTGSIQGVTGGPAAALGRRQTATGTPLTEPLPRARDFTMNGCPIGAALCEPVVVALPGAGTVPVPLSANPVAVIAVLDPTNLITEAERLRPRTVLPEMRIARDRSEEEELAPPDVRRDDY